MDTQYTLSTTEARQKLASVVSQVSQNGTRFTLTVNGVPRAVLINAQELESLQETVDILSQPHLVAKIAQAEQEFDNGAESQSLTEVWSDLVDA